MTCAQGRGCKNFYRLLSFSFSCGQSAPSTAPLHSMPHCSYTKVQDHDHSPRSRPSMQPLYFPFWWALWYFVTDFHRHWTSNLVEVITSVVWNTEKCCFMQWTIPTLHMYSTTTHSEFFTPLCSWEDLSTSAADGIGTAPLTTSAGSQAPSPFLSAVLSHTCSICANIFPC